MVPLSSAEIQALVAEMNLASDDVHIVDRQDRARDEPYATRNFVATREDLDLSNSSKFWFHSF